MQPKVSIIIPTNNDEKYITDTLNSVFNQTFNDYEVIIIDDCSSDKTVEIIKSFSDSRIRLFANDKNYGAAYSRNLGIKEANGQFIAFLDGDDLWKPTKLEKQIKFMEENHYDFTCTQYDIIDDDGISKGRYYSAPSKITYRKFRKCNYIGTLTAMFRRGMYPDLSCPIEIRRRNDYALWLKLSKRTPCYLLTEVLATYRKRDKSLSSISKSELMQWQRKMFQVLFGYNSFIASLCVLKNIYFISFKKLMYRRKIK